MSSHRASLSGNVLKIAGYKHQADAVISQANPVSTTLYEVLATTKNVRIIISAVQITWAVTQPTISIIITIDGQTLTYTHLTPVSATAYEPAHRSYDLPSAQPLIPYSATVPREPFFLEGRSVKVEVQVTWATTQPTPLVCRVKWAKIP